MWRKVGHKVVKTSKCHKALKFKINDNASIIFISDKNI